MQPEIQITRTERVDYIPLLLVQIKKARLAAKKDAPNAIKAPANKASIKTLPGFIGLLLMAGFSIRAAFL